MKGKNKKIEKYINWLIKDKYNGQLNLGLIEDLKKIKKGEPIDYIIGWIPFINIKIDLSLKPFIPRPETEYWVEKFIESVKNNSKLNKKEIKCLDLFSGSGCIGITVLKNLKNSYLDFVDIDKKALKQIKINLNLNKISSFRYQIIYSDIFENINSKYDFILANPPYVSEKLKNRLSSILKYEPIKAILAKENGLFYIKKIISQLKKYLKPKGVFWMEFSPEQKNEILKLIQQADFKNYQFNRDQYNRFRYLVLKNQ